MTPAALRWIVPASIFVFIWTLTTRGKVSASGDEPHYLIIAESLFTDRDLDLANNYQQGDGERFGAKDLTGGPHARTMRDGTLRSIHDIGVPILVLPLYAAATRAATLVPEALLKRFRQSQGLFAYSLISLTFAALTAFGCALLGDGLTRLTSPRTAAAIALAIGLSPPVLGHAFLVFPEVPAFVIVCSVVWLLCRRSDELQMSTVTAIVAAIGVLPGLHRKYAFLALGLLVVMARQHWPWIAPQSPARWTMLAMLGVGPQLAMHAWTLATWGHISGPYANADGIPLSISGMQTGALGLLFDRERGLFGYAPIYLIAPACWALTWRDSRWLLLPIAVLFFLAAAFADWSAGYSPAARYLVPLIPFIAMPAARALQWRAVRWVAVALLVFQAAILVRAWQHPRNLWPKWLGTNQILERIPVIGPAYESWLPSLATGDPIAGAWIAAATLTLATAALVIVSRRSAIGTSSSSMDRTM